MALNTQVPLQSVHNTAAELASKKGFANQVVVNVTDHTLHVMDGVKDGGYPTVPATRRFMSASDAITLNGAASAMLDGDILLRFDMSKVSAVFTPEIQAAQAAAASAQTTATNAQNTANAAKTTADAALPQTALSDAVNSAVSTTAATSLAVKTAYDKAVAVEAALGQVENATYVGEVGANSLTTPGSYVIDVSTTEKAYPKGWPVHALRGFVSVMGDGTQLSQLLITNGGFATSVWVRSSGNGGQNWTEWRPVSIDLVSNAAIYIHQTSGSDANTGLDSAYPVATFDRLMEIARATNVGKTGRHLYIRMSANNFGDVNFSSPGVAFTIQRYDGTHPAASETLPSFNTLGVRGGAAVTLEGIYAQRVILDNSTAIFGGCINRIHAWQLQNAAYLLMDNTASIWEVGQVAGFTGPAISVSTGSDAYFGHGTIQLVHNMTRDAFVDVGTNSQFTIDFGSTTITKGNLGLTGFKGKFAPGSIVSTMQTGVGADGYPTFLDNLPGVGVDISGSPIFNGVSYSDNALAKAAKTTADAALPKEVTVQAYPVYKLPGVWYGQDVVETEQFTFATANDSTGSWITRDYIGREVGGYFRYARYVRSGAGKLAVMSLIMTPSGQGLFEIPSPPASEVGNRGVTAAWVNSKLGSAASLTALATLDETAEGYVETIEVKRQKAIAQLNAEAMQAIYGGFSYAINGEEYLIGYSLFDQQNLADLAIDALGSDSDSTIAVPVRSMDGVKEWLELAPNAVRDLHKYGVLFKQTILQAADEKKARIMQANSDEEIYAIVME